MAYTIHNFEQGDVLYAEQLNEMDAQIAANEESIENSISFDMLAESYSANKTYSIGDYVVYNNELYTCVYEITAPEGWNSAHWRIANLGDGISDLNRHLSDVTGNSVITGWVDGWFVSTNGNTYNPNAPVLNAAFRYAFVDCAEGDVFTINGTGGGNPRLWAFADSSNNILSKAGNDATGSNLVIVAPSNATRLIINDKAKTSDSYYGEILVGKVDAIKDDVDSMLTVDFTENSGYISTSGSIVPASSEAQEVYTNRIFVKPGQKIDFSIRFSQTRDMWLGYARYDKYGKFLSRVGINSGNYIQYSTTVTADADTSYISFTYRTYGESVVNIRTNPISSLDGRIGNAESNITLFDYTINKNVKGINHRGFNTIAPENTFPAFRLSKKMGFGYVETDVQFNKSGTPVLMHDTTINRTCCIASTGESLVGQTAIYVADLYDADMDDYDACTSAKWDKYKGTKIPTFAEFIGLCKNIGLHPYIETKSDATYTQQQIESLVDIVKSYGMIDNVTWISFSATQIGYVKNYCSQARVGFIVSTISSSAIATVQGLGDNAFISAGSSNLTDELVSLCIDAGIPLETWTVNDASAVSSLNPYISGVTSDNLIAGYELYKSNIEG